MTELVELEIYQGLGSATLKKKVSINPEYIAYIEEDGDHALVHMSTKSVLHTVESRDTVLRLITKAKFGDHAYIK